MKGQSPSLQLQRALAKSAPLLFLSPARFRGTVLVPGEAAVEMLRFMPVGHLSHCK